MPTLDSEQVANMELSTSQPKIVLIIDDSEDICDAVRDILGEIGITVLTAADGQQGLEVYQENKEKIGVVFLDVVLPDLDGAEVLELLRQDAPTLPVVISSGYGDSVLADRYNDPHVSFLSKPFSFNDLVEKVEAAVQ